MERERSEWGLQFNQESWDELHKTARIMERRKRKLWVSRFFGKLGSPIVYIRSLGGLFEESLRFWLGRSGDNIESGSEGALKFKSR